MWFVMQGDTALHYAALTGKDDFALRLIQHQANVHAVNGQVSIPSRRYARVLA